MAAYAAMPGFVLAGGSGYGGRQVTSLDISKDVDSVSAPGYAVSLSKTASESYIVMEAGTDHPVSFTIQVGASQSGAYSVSGNIFVENTGEWPANVIAVSDTIWYKAGGPTWQPASTSVTTTVPLGPAAIGTGSHAYSYSGTFTLPVALSSVTAMSNLIEITIDNHPNDGVHVFHYRLSFPKPQTAGSIVSLSDVEAISPAGGVTYTIDAVTVNGSPASLSGPWSLDLASAPYTVIVEKTLHASAAGDYVLNNKAVIDGLVDEVDVPIHVPGEPEQQGAVEGFKLDEAQAPVAGVTIQLWQGDLLVAETVTGADGHYAFSGLALGEYTVREIVPAGWKALSPESVDVVLESEEPVRIDFQNARLQGAVEGFKLDEAQAPVAGVTIQLWQGDLLVAETVTGADGHYAFSGLALGEYTVREIVPAGWFALSPPSVDVVVEGEEAVRADFANARFSSIAGTKWNDLNGNGVHDEGEPGLAGVLISLEGEGILRQAVTAADGTYAFPNLRPGTYALAETVPAGWANTVPASLTVTVGYGEALNGIDFLNAEVLVAGEVITPPPAGEASERPDHLPLTGFDQLYWLVLAGAMALLGMMAIAAGLRDRLTR